jgi:DNA topoisomerase-2
MSKAKRSSSSSGSDGDKDTSSSDSDGEASAVTHAAVKPARERGGRAKTVHETYRRMTGVQHVLHRPELYVGMAQPVSETWWVPHPETQRMLRRHISFSPALFKIFDEILVNAADNKMRDAKQTKIDVTVDPETCTVSVFNDGAGIPVVRHKEYKMWIPQLIFGNLLTSSNYDDDETKITGGRHGYGAKLTNVFSKRFTVETCHKGTLYKKSWSNNMRVAHHDKITHGVRGGDFTRITFTPDLKRFELSSLDAGIVSLMHRRTLDVAATCGVAVTWNGKPAFITNFLEYARSFLPRQRVLVVSSPDEVLDRGGGGGSAAGGGGGAKRSASGGAGGVAAQPASLLLAADNDKDDASSRSAAATGREVKALTDNATDVDCFVFHQRTKFWEVVVAFHFDGGVDRNDHVTFVNNVATHNGGTHLKQLQDVITEQLCVGVKMSQRKDVARVLRGMMQVFCNVVVANPTFGSQIKDKLITPETQFTVPFRLTGATRAAFAASRLTQRVVEQAERQLGMVAAKNALRAVRIQGRVALPKLEDANFAGTPRSLECTLILTEGDSAKALAVSGLAVVGRDRFGVFPLKGKLLNVREASMQRVVENDQFSDVMKAVGLRFEETYDVRAPNLRYGRIMIMADQDHDGSHIKGLFMNFIHHFWPALLKRPGFITQFVTPIVKALPARRSGADAAAPSTTTAPASSLPTRSFYSIPDFLEWKNALSPAEQRKYTFKYYKGLGTSTAVEGREYFTAMARNSIAMTRHPQPRLDDKAIELAFSSAQIEARKVWVASYAADTHVGVDYTKKAMTYTDFVHKELLLFSVADCERSIPSVIDGLKPSQRKILFACFKRNITRSIKVEQLAGYVSEQTAYHHGEASLHGAIVNLAQDFVGSNNIPLLVPEGQFGTRHEGGKDHASARYIFTRLSPLARLLFPAADDALLAYKDDDGFPIEPHYYVPVIPVVLVNGAAGIGTGFATSIPSYHPLHVIDNVRRLIRGEAPKAMQPWHEGYTGDYEVATEGDPPEDFYFTTNAVSYRDDGVLQIADRSKDPIADAVDAAATRNEVITITDLAPGTTTSSIKRLLVEFENDCKIDMFSENHTPSTVHFSLRLAEKLTDAERCALMGELTKRRTTFRTSNMYGFDRLGSLRLFASTADLMAEHFAVRMQLYRERHQHVSAQLRRQLAIEQSRRAFIDSVCTGAVSLKVLRDEAALVAFCRARRYARSNAAAATATKGAASSSSSSAGGGGGGGGGSPGLLLASASQARAVAAASADGEEGAAGQPAAAGAAGADAAAAATATGFEYLLRMPISSFNKESLARAGERVARTATELKTHEARAPKDVYLDELAALEAAVSAHYARREEARAREAPVDATGSSGRRRVKRRVVAGGASTGLLKQTLLKAAPWTSRAFFVASRAAFRVL